jgi:hypothetical protein
MPKYPSLLGAKTIVLTQEQLQHFLQLSIGEMRSTPRLFTPEIANEFGLPGKILFSRLGLCGIKVSGALALWCIILANDNPGTVVLWAWTLREMFIAQKQRMLTVSDWTHAFPMGVPTQDEISRVWDAQKEEGAPAGNGLDRGENWTVNSERQSDSQPQE